MSYCTPQTNRPHHPTRTAVFVSQPHTHNQHHSTPDPNSNPRFDLLDLSRQPLRKLGVDRLPRNILLELLLLLLLQFLLSLLLLDPELLVKLLPQGMHLLSLDCLPMLFVKLLLLLLQCY